MGNRAQPVFRQRDRLGLTHQIEPLEDVPEDLVKTIEMALVLHQRGAREVVEIFNAPVGEVSRQRLHQRQVFPERDGYLCSLELVKECREHDQQAFSFDASKSKPPERKTNKERAARMDGPLRQIGSCNSVELRS